MSEFRGFPACECLIEWLPAYERELQRRGVLEGQLRIFQLIGDFSGSGGTHAGGGAFDITDIFESGADVWVARQMGADATWARTRAQGFTPHIHGVLRGCPHLTLAARNQIVAVENNGDGLDGDAPDDGPRPLSGRTFREGIAWAQQQEALMVTNEDKQIIRDIIREELTAFAKVFGEVAKVDHDGDPKTAKWSLERELRSHD